MRHTIITKPLNYPTIVKVGGPQQYGIIIILPLKAPGLRYHWQLIAAILDHFENFQTVLPFLPKCLMQPKNFFMHFRCLLRVVVSNEKKFEKSRHLSLFWTNSGKTLKNHRQKCCHAIWIFFSDLISQRMYLSMKKRKKWHFFFVVQKTAIKV